MITIAVPVPQSHERKQVEKQRRKVDGQEKESNARRQQADREILFW